MPITLSLTANVGRTLEQEGRTDFSVRDRLAIKNVIASHFRYLDNFRIDKWMTNFVDDAKFIGEINDQRIVFQRSEFENVFRERFRKFKQNGMQRRHVISNILFANESENSATIHANGLLLSTADGEPTELVNGLTFEKDSY